MSVLNASAKNNSFETYLCQFSRTPEEHEHMDYFNRAIS